MKKVNFTHLRSKLPFLFLLVFLLTFSTTIYSQEEAAEATTADAGGDVAAGEALFKANCAACHKMDAKAVGPALRGVADKFDRDWLHKWIRNSQGLVNAGDPIAVKLFEENNRAIMTPFPALSDADIDNILAYTSQPKPEPVVAVTPTDTGASGGGGGVSNTLILGALVLLMALLVTALYVVTNTLKRLADAKGVEIEKKEKRTPLWKAFVQNQFLVLVVSIFLMLAAGYWAFGYMMQIGVDQGYAPVHLVME